MWQARWFGPIYPVVFGLWFVGGTIAGALLWLVRGRRERLGAMVESCAYYSNPFEWWAYSRDDHWPPKAVVKGVGWKKAAVRPLAEVRAKADRMAM